MPGYESDMPAFAGVLSDQQIRDVLAFIKSTWPKRELSYQAEASRWEAEEASVMIGCGPEVSPCAPRTDPSGRC